MKNKLLQNDVIYLELEVNLPNANAIKMRARLIQTLLAQTRIIH